MGDYDLLPLTFAAVALLAEEKLDARGRRLAQLIFWVPALQLLFGNLQFPGPAFVAPVFAVYPLQKLFTPADGSTRACRRIIAVGRLDQPTRAIRPRIGFTRRRCHNESGTGN